MTLYEDRVEEILAERLEPDVDGGRARDERIAGLMHQMIDLIVAAYSEELAGRRGLSQHTDAVRKRRARLRVVRDVAG